MVKQSFTREHHALETHLKSVRGDVLSNRNLFDLLHKALPGAEVLIISSLPRGGLQIVQPAKLAETTLKAYAKGFATMDVPSWQAISTGKVFRGTDDKQFDSSPFVTGFMASRGWRYVAVAPLNGPVLEGYAGALHVYRSSGQNDFTRAELEQISTIAKEIDQAIARNRPARQVVRNPESEWTHRPALRQFIFDSDVKLVYPDQKAFGALDERLRDQIVKYARSRLHHVNGELTTSDRIMIPDASGDLWVFRAVAYKKYPALGGGPVVFFCLQPDSVDWSTLKPADFQADSEISRLIPALRFMQDQFHRGPTLHEISKTVHLSPFHFHRRFTELLGITPKHFMLECQIHEAKVQLIGGEKDLVDIARDCGFAHQSHFTSRFKQATGLTPTRWRRLARRLQSASQS